VTITEFNNVTFNFIEIYNSLNTVIVKVLDHIILNTLTVTYSDVLCRNP